MEVNGQLHTPAALPPGKDPPGTRWIGGWVGPRVVLEAVVKKKKFQAPAGKGVNYEALHEILSIPPTTSSIWVEIFS
jgi:hypothetical protein